MTERKMIKSVMYLLPVVFLIQAYYTFDHSTSNVSGTKFSSSKKRKLEFVHITKTGGSAIEKAGYQDGIIW